MNVRTYIDIQFFIHIYQGYAKNNVAKERDLIIIQI